MSLKWLGIALAKEPPTYPFSYHHHFNKFSLPSRLSSLLPSSSSRGLPFSHLYHQSATNHVQLGVIISVLPMCHLNFIVLFTLGGNSEFLGHVFSLPSPLLFPPCKIAHMTLLFFPEVAKLDRQYFQATCVNIVLMSCIVFCSHCHLIHQVNLHHI